MRLPLGSLRVVSPVYTGDASGVKDCNIQGCRKITSGGKPYCDNHVDLNPYVQGLHQDLLQRKAEDTRVLKEGSVAVNIQGITIKEILRILRQNGTRTEERLEKDLQLPKSMIHGYVCALQNRGIVKITMSLRGGMLVNFLKDLDDEEEDE